MGEKTLSEMLCDALEEKGWNQNVLAKRSGISAGYISLLLNNKRKNIQEDKLMKLAVALQMDVTVLRKAAGLADDDEEPRPIVVGISGASCSGKTWLTRKIQGERPDIVSVLDLDGFYRDKEYVDTLEYKYDNPLAVDLEQALVALTTLKSGKPVTVPIYDYRTHKQTGTRTIPSMPIIVVEGLFIYLSGSWRKQIDIKLWMESDKEIRSIRRILRDTSDGRNRLLQDVVDQYIRDVVPGYGKFLHDSRRHADVTIVNDGMDGKATPLAVNMVLSYIERLPWLSRQ